MREKGVRPCKFTPADQYQRDELEIYALVSGFKTIDRLALRATVQLVDRNKLSKTRQLRFDKLMKERHPDYVPVCEEDRGETMEGRSGKSIDD